MSVSSFAKPKIQQPSREKVDRLLLFS
ncbi:unnamed protein product, partial [Didymodactylos carnosus]